MAKRGEADVVRCLAKNGETTKWKHNQAGLSTNTLRFDNTPHSVSVHTSWRCTRQRQTSRQRKHFFLIYDFSFCLSFILVDSFLLVSAHFNAKCQRIHIIPSGDTLRMWNCLSLRHNRIIRFNEIVMCEAFDDWWQQQRLTTFGHFSSFLDLFFHRLVEFRCMLEEKSASATKRNEKMSFLV